MKSILAIACLAILPSCIAMAAGAAAGNSVAQRAIEPFTLNAWTDEGQTFDRTGRVTDGNSDWPTDLAIAAPAWSYGGMKLRLARPVDQRKVGELEIQLRVTSDSGLHPVAVVGDARLAQLGEQLGWSRFALPSPGGADLVVVSVQCELGDWVFRLPASYFAGFERKVAELRKSL